MSIPLVYYAALSSNDLIGPKRFEMILHQCGSIERFFDLSVEEQIRCVGVSPEHKNLFQSMIARGEEILRVCKNNNIDIIPIEDPRFPSCLRDIPDPPFLLYVKGKILPHYPLVGIVGTRQATPEALEINRYFCRELVGFGIGIVSGLAQGHDEMAHRTVLEYGGYTLAVLGTSFTHVATHRKTLYETISEHGAIITEYHPLAMNHKWRFRFRNRLIAGLSRAVIVMQAPEKSGALITAEFARIQGRPLFFIPGNPLDLHYAGSNALAKKGGILATTPEDIVKVIFSQQPLKTPAVANEELPLLSQEEHLLFKSLPSQFSIEELIEKSEKSVAEILSLLTQLEVKGYIMQYPGNIYEKRL